MRSLITTLLVCVFPLLALAADKPKDLIVGKWESLDGLSKGVIVEYKADGNITASFKEKTMPTGKYKFVEDDLMEVNVSFKVGDKDIASLNKYRVKVTKEELTTIDEKSKVEKKFKRVP
jgi:hypothetical protein